MENSVKKPNGKDPMFDDGSVSFWWEDVGAIRDAYGIRGHMILLKGCAEPIYLDCNREDIIRAWVYHRQRGPDIEGSSDALE